MEVFPQTLQHLSYKRIQLVSYFRESERNAKIVAKKFDDFEMQIMDERVTRNYNFIVNL